MRSRLSLGLLAGWSGWTFWEVVAARLAAVRAAVAVVVVWCCLVAACTSTPPDGTRSAPGVRAWVTTASGSHKLSDRGPVPYVDGGSGKPDIVVENGRRYQQFFGVGASITGSSAVLLDTLPDDVRSRVMRDIFQPGQGIGLSVLRQPLGGNDFSTSDFSFTRGLDEDHVLPLLTEAARLAPSLAVVLSPWSAPASMKTSGSLVGGSLRPEDAGAYADYLVGAARAYLDAGVPVRGLTVQNEPSYSPPSYPGMTLDTGQQRTLLRDHVAPASGGPGCGCTCGRSTTTSTGGRTPTRCSPTRPPAGRCTASPSTATAGTCRRSASCGTGTRASRCRQRVQRRRLVGRLLARPALRRPRC